MRRGIRIDAELVREIVRAGWPATTPFEFWLYGVRPSWPPEFLKSFTSLPVPVRNLPLHEPWPAGRIDERGRRRTQSDFFGGRTAAENRSERCLLTWPLKSPWLHRTSSKCRISSAMEKTAFSSTPSINGWTALNASSPSPNSGRKWLNTPLPTTRASSRPTARAEKSMPFSVLF